MARAATRGRPLPTRPLPPMNSNHARPPTRVAARPGQASAARLLGRLLLAQAIAWAALLPLAAPAAAAPAAVSKPPRWMAARYAEALTSFRQARFPEAYGRFVAIAEWGYVPAARHALWMCENGQELFGSPFDCAPHEIQTWALQVGTNPRDALRRIYPGEVVDEAPVRVRR